MGLDDLNKKSTPSEAPALGLGRLGSRIDSAPYIDVKTSTVNGLIKQLAEKHYARDILKGLTRFKGQVLRVTTYENYDSSKDQAYEDEFSKRVSGIKNFAKCKVAVPQLDFFPVPNTFDETPADRAIIDLYHKDYYLDPTNPSFDSISPGDIVTVTYDDLEKFEGGIILMKINSQSNLGSVPPVGSTPKEVKPEDSFKEKPKTNPSETVKEKDPNKPVNSYPELPVFAFKMTKVQNDVVKEGFKTFTEFSPIVKTVCFIIYIIETGNGNNCFNYNLGGIRGDVGRWSQGSELVKGTVVAKKKSGDITNPQGIDQVRYLSFDTLEEGSKFKLIQVNKKFNSVKTFKEFRDVYYSSWKAVGVVPEQEKEKTLNPFQRQFKAYFKEFSNTKVDFPLV